MDLLRSRLGFEVAGGQRLVHQEDGIPGAVSISGLGPKSVKDVRDVKGPQVEHIWTWSFLANSGNSGCQYTAEAFSAPPPIDKDKSSKTFKGSLCGYKLPEVNSAVTPSPTANALHFGQVHRASQRKASKVCAALLCRTSFHQILP